jgi:L-ascorbate metabolism protein UlaG (beta-lactamase superfamily)
MKLTKFGHACVRLERDGGVLVIDPGVYSDPVAMDGAAAVLITHEHQDHFDEAALRGALEANPGLRVWTVGPVAAQLEGVGAGRVSVVGHGDAFTAGGFEVQGHGEWHALVHEHWGRVPNTGFLVEGVFHPGDALTVPDQPVDTLLLPVHAPWSKLAEVVDYTNAVGARRALAVHDGGLSEIGLGTAGYALNEIAPGTAYERLEPGASVEL